MKHQTTSQMYIYWNRLRGKRSMPDRIDIEPSDIREFLRDTFILERHDNNAYNFRLAGTRICANFGRELKGRNFVDYMDQESVEAVQTILHACGEDASANVMGFVGKTQQGNSVALEAIFLPVSVKNSTDVRLIGTIVPMASPYWIGMQSIQTLQLSSFRMVLPHQHVREVNRMLEKEHDSTEDNVTLFPSREISMARAFQHPDGRQVRHLTVIEGGASGQQ